MTKLAAFILYLILSVVQVNAMDCRLIPRETSPLGEEILYARCVDNFLHQYCQTKDFKAFLKCSKTVEQACKEGIAERHDALMAEYAKCPIESFLEAVDPD